MQNIKTISFNIDKDIFTRIDAKQNDVKSRYLRFLLTSNSLPINLTTHTVKIFAIKKDNTKIFNTVTVEDEVKGQVLIELTSQALAVAGDLRCELVIYGADSSVISTKVFIINVLESIRDENAIESTNEFSALTEGITKLEMWDSQFQQKYDGLEAEYATELTETKTTLNDIPNQTYITDKAKKVDVDNVLILKAEKSYVDSKLGSMGNTKFFKGSVLFANLPTTSNAVDNYFYVLDKGTNYCWNGTAWVDIGNNLKIGDNSIPLEKTTFVKAGKNKFNSVYIPNAIISGDIVNGMYVANRIGGVIAIVNIDGGKTYTVSKGTGGDRFRIGSSSTYPVFYDTAPIQEQKFHGLYVSDGVKATVNVPSGDNYLIIYVQSAGSTVTPVWLQVEEGAVATEYTPQKVVIDMEERSINDYAVKKMLAFGMLAGNKECFIVDIKSKTITSLLNGQFVLYEDKNVIPISDQTISLVANVKTTIILFNLDTKLFEVSSISGLSTNLSKTNKIIIGSVRIDTTTNYMVNIFGNYTIIDNGSNTPIVEDNFILPSDNFSNFISSGTFIPTPTNNLNDIYSIYDNLVASYPQYVSRTLLGNNSAGQPIYRYDFIPSNHSSDVVFPKILYVSCTHGHEKEAAIGGARFFKELCDDWENNDVLRLLRFNVHLIAIPILNPYGFTNDVRKNGNGVDLNRNYPTGWSIGGSTDISSDNYRGIAPLSEIETTLIDNTFKNESNLIFAIDHHNSGTHTWLGSNIKRVRKTLFGVGQLITSYLEENNVGTYNYVPISVVADGSTTCEANSLGLSGSIIETSFTVTSNTDLQYDQKHTTEVVGNIIINALRKQILK